MIINWKTPEGRALAFLLTILGEKPRGIIRKDLLVKATIQNDNVEIRHLLEVMNRYESLHDRILKEYSEGRV